MAKDIKGVLKALKAPAGAMTADMAIIGLKIVFGETLGGVLGTGLKEFLKQNKDKTEEELKKVTVSDEIQKEIQIQLKQYMTEQGHPLYMNGVVFFFEETVLEEDAAELKGYMEQEYDAEDLDQEDARYQKIVDEFLRNYPYDDYGIFEDTLYINFDDVSGNILYAEDDMREAAHALNFLRRANLSGNAIESLYIF